MFSRFKNWVLLKLTIWKLNSLRRSIKRLGWVKSQAQFDAMADELGRVIWGQKLDTDMCGDLLLTTADGIPVLQENRHNAVSDPSRTQEERDQRYYDECKRAEAREQQIRSRWTNEKVEQRKEEATITIMNLACDDDAEAIEKIIEFAESLEAARNSRTSGSK
jgi:alpha-galactosidase/6-phospho-beta-glucosidase family protein